MAAPAMLVAALLLGPRGGASAEPYSIDYRRSSLVVRLYRAGVGSALAHDHVVGATRWHGTLDVNQAPVALSADVRVDATALEVDEPPLRARYGLDGALSEDDRKEVRETMLGPSQLDAAKHPEIRFRAAEIDRADAGFRVAGDLTIHGVTRRVAFLMQVERSGDELRAQGSLRLKQTDFGIEPYSALLGAVRNQDDFDLLFDVVARPLRAAARR
ncbi:MAG: YceI family protein [Thermodesulfobacteriota bacterium]